MPNLHFMVQRIIMLRQIAKVRNVFDIKEKFSHESSERPERSSPEGVNEKNLWGMRD